MIGWVRCKILRRAPASKILTKGFCLEVLIQKMQDFQHFRISLSLFTDDLSLIFPLSQYFSKSKRLEAFGDTMIMRLIQYFPAWIKSAFLPFLFVFLAAPGIYAGNELETEDSDGWSVQSTQSVVFVQPRTANQPPKAKFSENSKKTVRPNKSINSGEVELSNKIHIDDPSATHVLLVESRTTNHRNEIRITLRPTCSEPSSKGERIQESQVCEVSPPAPSVVQKKVLVFKTPKLSGKTGKSKTAGESFVLPLQGEELEGEPIKIELVPGMNTDEPLELVLIPQPCDNPKEVRVLTQIEQKTATEKQEKDGAKTKSKKEKSQKAEIIVVPIPELKSPCEPEKTPTGEETVEEPQIDEEEVDYAGFVPEEDECEGEECIEEECEDETSEEEYVDLDEDAEEEEEEDVDYEEIVEDEETGEICEEEEISCGQGDEGEEEGTEEEPSDSGEETPDAEEEVGEEGTEEEAVLEKTAAPGEKEPVLEEEKTTPEPQNRRKPVPTLQKPEKPLISPTPEPEGTSTKLLRYPDVYRYDVVFVYAGDLWTVKTKGGLAVRLTAHEGLELFPKYSPDGKWIAFTGQYDGDEQVYIIPSRGGVPKQLTFYPAKGPFPPRRGYDNIVYGWTPDGKYVLFRSLRDSNGVTELGALYKVSVEGGLPEQLPMPTAGAGDYSPDGKKIVYSPLFRDFRTWKRYEGGWAQYLAIFDLNKHTFKKIAVSPRTERDPMWIKNAIYFVSDRDGTLNLYRYDLQSEKVRKITRSKDWDVRWASSDGRSKIVYEFGGELKLYNIETDEVRDIPITVPHDGLSMRSSRYDVSKNIESFSLAPGGKRAAVIARGDVFSVPAEQGAARNLTQSSGVHDREAVWSYDGTRIAYISDQCGEDQLYIVDQRGTKAAEQLTDAFSTRLTKLAWSPNGKFLSVCDSEDRLFVVATADFGDFEKGIPIEVVKEKNGGSPDSTWSPCSEYLALTLNAESGFTSVYIWERETQQLSRITDPNNDGFSPCWDPEGKYLYYMARHEYAPQFSSLEWNYAGNRNIGVYALALRKDVPNLFTFQSDEVDLSEFAADDSDEDATSSSSEKEKAENKGKPKTSKRPEKLKIDFDGLSERVARVPLSFENYRHLRTNGQYLFYIQSGASFYGRETYEKPSIRVFDLKERKETKLASDISGTYVLSPDGSKIIFKIGNAIKICNANSATQTQINLPVASLAVDRVPAEEWEEIFNETCRKFRDYFYVKNMHGYDWKEICDQYRGLLPYVAHRSDLNYLLGEMVAELNVGHAYIQGGDFTVPRRAKVGLPGARFALDKESNLYRISKIYKGQNQEPKYRAPLTEIGVEVSEGDYILEIDGKQLFGEDNPYRLLQNKTTPITLKVNSEPSLEGAREITYQPVFDESDLLYLDFVKDRMERVEKATDGRVGYIHIPDMGATGAYEFIKWYYPQIRKEGLVIDVRSNGGGNISQWIIMKLSQKLLGTRYGSTKETPTTYPYTVFHGQMVCLINETSASDGDIFPFYFRKSGLGPVIGKKSWGGVVGISGRGALIDGGEVMVPLSATNDENGEFIIEGKGVTPDIEVENDPKSMIQGKDLQLERGIEEVVRKIEIDPKKLPSRRPLDPVKTKDVIKDYSHLDAEQE